LIVGMAAAIAAMFCKEFVVTLPVMLALYDFYFFDSSKETIGARCGKLMPFFIIALIVPVLLLRTPTAAVGVANIADSHLSQGGGAPQAGSHINVTRANNSIGRGQYFLTELNVVCTYVRLMFLPVNQNFDYDYPLSNQADNKTAVSGMLLFCLLVLAVFMYRDYRLISFGILWFFIALSVESSVIPIGHVIAEYRLYLASVGFVFLVINLIIMRKGDLKLLSVMAAMVLVELSVMTYQRNKVWGNELALWDDAVHKSPHKARPYCNRGSVYYNQGKLDQNGSLLNVSQAKACWTRFAARHNGGGNLLFADGHVAKFSWPEVQYPASSLAGGWVPSSDANQPGKIVWCPLGPTGSGGGD